MSIGITADFTQDPTVGFSVGTSTTLAANMVVELHPSPSFDDRLVLILTTKQARQLAAALQGKADMMEGVPAPAPFRLSPSRWSHIFPPKDGNQ